MPTVCARDLRTGAAYVLSDRAPCVAAAQGRPSGPLTPERKPVADCDDGDIVWIEWREREWLPVRIDN